MTQHRGSILFLSHETSRTGAPLFLLRYLRWLHQSRDIKFRILVGRTGEIYSEFKSVAPVYCFEPPKTILYRLLRKLSLHRRLLEAHLAGLREKLIQCNISLIYVNSVASAEILEYLNFLKCPVICHVHELEGAIENLGRQTMAILKKRTTLYIAVSPAVEANLTKKHGIPTEQIRLIENFIFASEQSTLSQPRARKLIVEELAIPPDAKIVCACGTAEFRKGVDLFLQVAHSVVHNFRTSSVHFIWLGEGEKTKYAKQAKLLGLDTVVHFIGQKVDVNPYFSASDVFLMTSREEPFGLVMLEAALHQKPIVCFDHSGYPPHFVGRDAGIIIPDFDTNAMSVQLMHLLASPNLCRRMGITAKKKVLERHTMEIGAVKITTAIEELSH